MSANLLDAFFWFALSLSSAAFSSELRVRMQKEVNLFGFLFFMISFNHGSGTRHAGRWISLRGDPSIPKYNDSALDSSHVDLLLRHRLDSLLCSHDFVKMFQSCRILASFFRSCISEACGHVVTRR